MNFWTKCILYSVFFCCFEAQISFSSRCTYPHVEHARVKFRSRTRIAKFMCYPGYTLVGSKYVFCSLGVWEEPFPVCVKPGCPKLLPLTNGLQMKRHDDAWVMTFCYSGYELRGSQTIFCNGYRWNGTMPSCVEATKNNTSSNYSCDFEQDLCGWVQDEYHDFDWTRLNSKTPSFFAMTGPLHDHTLGSSGKGHFMYIESTNRNVNDTARLISPIYDEAVGKDGCFQMYYHMYGRSIGGLRVYQIPVNLSSSASTEVNKQKYIIFEKWGNLGNQWFSTVSRLKDFNSNFQIVIEGIRGSSFMSDLAFDDVAILRGENCTETAITPRSFNTDSCVGRCFNNLTLLGTITCGCSEDCAIYGYCCEDFIETCVDTDTTTTKQSSTEEQPQTQKLVLSTTTTTTTTTTLRPTTKIITTKPISTTKATVKTTEKTTVPSTTKKITSTIKTIPTTKPKPVTTKRTTIKTTTTPKPTTTRRTTIKPTFSPFTISDKIVAKKAPGTSKTMKATGVTIAVLLCVLVVVGSVVGWRRYGGMMIIRRLRGRATGDSEVRYLTSNADD